MAFSFQVGQLPSVVVTQRLNPVGREREIEVAPISPDAESAVSELLGELVALRGRLDQAPAWFRCPLDTMKAGALAEEVKQLCQEAGCSVEEVEVARLLAQARQNLDRLQVLLGLH